MKRNLRRRNSAFTLVGLFVVVGVCALLFSVLDILVTNAKKRALRLPCVNNMKQCALATTVWANDNQGQFPMAVSSSNTFGGSLEWVPGGNAFRHFQVMANELGTPKVVCCPADVRLAATNFTTDFDNNKVSFFVGLDAKKSDPNAFLFGDRNITNGIAPDHTVLTLNSRQSVGWNKDMHSRCGNIALADASVQQLSNRNLQRTIKEFGVWTNRLALPE